MAIINIDLEPATPLGERLIGTQRTGTPSAPIAGTALDEDHIFNLTVPLDAGPMFPFGDTHVRMHSLEPSGTVTGVFNVVVSQHSNTTVSTVDLTVRIIEVLTPEAETGNITSFGIQNFEIQTGVTPGGVASAITTGGFVQAIFTGNESARNADKREITVSFGPDGTVTGTHENITTYPLQVGVAIPAGATLSNPHLEGFNILLNT